MLTLSVTDDFNVTIQQVSVLTGFNIQMDRHNNVLGATAIFTHFENSLAYGAGVPSGNDQYDISALINQIKAGILPPTAAAIETYLMQTGQPFFGATQSTTPSQ